MAAGVAGVAGVVGSVGVGGSGAALHTEVVLQIEPDTSAGQETAGAESAATHTSETIGVTEKTLVLDRYGVLTARTCQ